MTKQELIDFIQREIPDDAEIRLPDYTMESVPCKKVRAYDNDDGTWRLEGDF